MRPVRLVALGVSMKLISIACAVRAIDAFRVDADKSVEVAGMVEPLAPRSGGFASGFKFFTDGLRQSLDTADAAASSGSEAKRAAGAAAKQGAKTVTSTAQQGVQQVGGAVQQVGNNAKQVALLPVNKASQLQDLTRSLGATVAMSDFIVGGGRKSNQSTAAGDEEEDNEEVMEGRSTVDEEDEFVDTFPEEQDNKGKGKRKGKTRYPAKPNVEKKTPPASSKKVRQVKMKGSPKPKDKSKDKERQVRYTHMKPMT